MLELGTTVTEIATGLPGMLTHCEILMDRSFLYLFQPHGLQPENGEPLPKMWCVENLIEGADIVDDPDDEILDILGTQVEDTASGFKGMATAIVLHINGCCHAQVQPRGLSAKGMPIQCHEFDIRQLKGDAIPVLTKEEKIKDQKAKPSPVFVTASHSRMVH